MRAAILVKKLRWLLLALGLAVAMRHWVWMPALISGESMQPTLRHGQLVGINILAYRLDRPRRGEIVGVKTASGLMIKRVLGVPGEHIALRNGIFYVNGVRLAEPYVQFRDMGTIGDGFLGPNHFVLAGDNRSKTIIAVVNGDRILGRVRRQQPATQVSVARKNLGSLSRRG